jgi:cytochrome c-type biogenesis protein CcmH/NrfG
MKFAILAVVALVLIVAGLWFFWPNPPAENPQRESGGSLTGTGQQTPGVQTPAPTAPSPTGSETHAADRLQQIEAAKRQGDNYYDNGEYDNAINAYQEGLKLDPSNPQLLQALQRVQRAKATENNVNQ